MYSLNPRAVFAHERVFDNPRALERMDRMLDALGMDRNEVPTVNIADVPDILEVAGVDENLASERNLEAGHGRIRQGLLKVEDDPVMVFNTFVWDEDERLEAPREYANPHARRLQAQFCGVGEDFAFSRRDLFSPQSPHYICQGGWGVHTLGGCVHKCDYCGQGFIVNVMLDIDEFCEHVAAMFERRPRQLLYRYDLYSDILAFEPEYGASETLVRTFAEYDKYLLLYTRSNNVEWLADLPHKDHAPINWTISMDTQARLIERDSPTLEERLDAMRFCQEHGFTVRAGFSPVVPVSNWREETTEMLEMMFDRVEPEVLRAWVLAMMDADEFERIFDTDAMDQRFMRRMREEADKLDGTHQAPFPLDGRTEIYQYYIDEIKRISPETPFAICTEHPAVWDALEDQLKMTRTKMFCCCGGMSPPGAWDGENTVLTGEK
ncbi:MAG: spore photoproduct lyase family protein [Candidatus Brocadiia bacterium]